MKNIMLNNLLDCRGIFAGYLLLKQNEMKIVEEFLNRFHSKNTRNGGCMSKPPKVYNRNTKSYFIPNKVSIQSS